MARTQTDILREINQEANRHADLAALQSNRSRVSVWGYVKQVVAFAIRTLEEGFDTHKKEIRTLLDNQQTGTLNWYREQALKWQRGHQLRIQDNRVFYAKNDPSSQIITHAAVEESTGRQAGTIQVKVVKDDPKGDVYEALSTDELTAFSAYMKAVAFAGLNVQSSSAEAVPISITGTIQIDPQQLTTLGTQVSDTNRKPIEEALDAYLRDLPFNGIIRRTALVDAIQAVPGVVDVFISELKHYLPPPAAPGTGSPFKVTHQPSSGHASLSKPPALTYQTNTISEPQ